MTQIKRLLFALAFTTSFVAGAQDYGGVDIGTGNFHGNDRYYEFNDVYGYLEAVSAELNNGIMMAYEERQYGDLSGARRAVVESYRAALRLGQKYRGPYSPLTVDALERGIDLHMAFSGVCGTNRECQNREDEVATLFLVSYSKHIEERIIPLDDKYYLPFYHGSCHRHWDRRWWDMFVTDYKTAAANLLALYTGRSTNRSLPMSLHRDIYEVQVAEAILRAATNDMNRDVFRRSFRRPISTALGVLRYVDQQRSSGRLADPFVQKRVRDALYDASVAVRNQLEDRIGLIEDDYRPRRRGCH